MIHFSHRPSAIFGILAILCFNVKRVTLVIQISDVSMAGLENRFTTPVSVFFIKFLSHTIGL